MPGQRCRRDNRCDNNEFTDSRKPTAALDFLSFDLTEVDDGVSSLEAMASTALEQHPAVMAEVQQVLDWAWRHCPGSHGPVDDGMDWDHDLQVLVEDGGWHTVTLTLTGTARFVEAFIASFGSLDTGSRLL